MPAQARFPVAAFKVFLSPSFCKKHFTGGGFFAPFFRGKAFMRCFSAPAGVGSMFEEVQKNEEMEYDIYRKSSKKRKQKK